MTRTLQLVFLTSGDKKVTLSIDEPKLNLTAEEVKTAMNEVIERNIFKIEDYSFVSAVSAKIVERAVTDFDLA